MLVERKSPLTGMVNTLDLAITAEMLDAWQGGMYIQDAMPHLTADEREFLMTGFLPGEFDAMFGEDA